MKNTGTDHSDHVAVPFTRHAQGITRKPESWPGLPSLALAATASKYDDAFSVLQVPSH